MGDQPWLNRVRERLARQALPSAYIRRLMEELSDHLEDFKEESMETDAYCRLGEPEQVAEAAATAYRRRSFLGRHPTAAFLVFAISPVIAQYVLFCVGGMVLMTLRADHTLDWYENHWILSLIIVVCSTFLSIVYGELAMRLGIGRKWMLASCAVLGAFGLLLELGLRVPVMALAQFAAPLAVGWWFTKRKCNRGYPATTFLVFAISPVASYMLLWVIVVLAFATGQSFLNVYLALTAVYVVPTVVASLLYCKLAKEFGSGRRWTFALCLVLATFVATPFAPLLLIYVVPTVVASLLYCKLAKRFGSGEKWMFVSCLVLATFGAMQSFQSFLAGYETAEGHCRPPIGLTMCISLAQFLIPLAIGWWFMRRKHDQGQLELAS
jgi:hypothetical protein